MDTVKAIFTRKSIRKYTEQNIDGEGLKIILNAGMSGPSCVNARDWSFIVVRDKETLNKMADANGHPAEPLRDANVGILVCGDLDRAFKPAKDYWIIDCAIATQNMVLAAHSLGIGSVWLGTYPQMDRVFKQATLFKLPKSIVPHSILALGYPADTESLKPDKNSSKSVWNEGFVHYEKW